MELDERGKHLLLDIWLNEVLTDQIVRRIEDIVRRRFEVVRETRKLFEPQGETVVFILSESHFTIHTYPEFNYVSLDIYVCDVDAHLDGVADEILSELKVKEFNKFLLPRGFGRPKACREKSEALACS